MRYPLLYVVIWQLVGRASTALFVLVGVYFPRKGKTFEPIGASVREHISNPDACRLNEISKQDVLNAILDCFNARGLLDHIDKPVMILVSVSIDLLTVSELHNFHLSRGRRSLVLGSVSCGGR